MSDNEEVVSAGVTESLTAQIEDIKAKADANLAGWQRAQADFANYKRRAEQEKDDAVKYGNASLVLKILPVLDDLERAVGSLPEEVAGNPWAEGMKLIERKLRTSLESQGLAPIQAVGEPFDPRLHEAVREDPGPEGTVIGEMEKGYRLHDRVIRPSKVIVGKGEE